MKDAVLTKIKTDKKFNMLIWATAAMMEGPCSNCKDNIDFTCNILDFLESEYGVLESDIEQIMHDIQNEFDEFEKSLPKCCNKQDMFHGKCKNCGKDMVEIPGYWEMWRCPDCKGRRGDIYACRLSKVPDLETRCKFLPGYNK